MTGVLRTIQNPTDRDLEIAVAGITQAEPVAPGTPLFWLCSESASYGPCRTLELRASEALIDEELSDPDDVTPFFTARVYQFTPDDILRYARLLVRGSFEKLAADLNSAEA
jgi:hypothetical protein